MWTRYPMIPVTSENIVLAILFIYGLVLLLHHGAQKALYSEFKDFVKILKLNEEALYMLLQSQKDLNGVVTSFSGQVKKTHMECRIATKFAERANSLASSANIGVAILQRSLSVKKPNTAEQASKNRFVLSELAKKNDEAVDWLEPVLSEEEREIVEFARAKTSKN